MANKLCVSGCSFSNADANHGVVKPYGQLAAEQLGMEYFHNAVNAGSNERIWRTVTTAILDGKLTPNDTLVIQYTILARREFWSPYNYRPEASLHEPYGDGSLYRLTAFDEYAVHKEKTLHMIMSAFYDHDYTMELFKTRHHQFMGFLESRGFNKAYFFKCANYGWELDKSLLTPYFYDKVLDGRNLMKDDKHNSDSGHMNQNGHYNAAKVLVKQLENR